MWTDGSERKVTGEPTCSLLQAWIEELVDKDNWTIIAATTEYIILQKRDYTSKVLIKNGQLEDSTKSFINKKIEELICKKPCSACEIYEYCNKEWKEKKAKEKIKKLFVRSLSNEEKKKLKGIIVQVIDFLRKELKLKIWECYFIVKILHEEFPIEYLFEEKEE